MIFFYIINLLLCVWMAARDAQALKDGGKIKHAINGAVHLITGLLVGVFYGWPHGIAWLCECAVVFDVSLSLFRGLHPFYVSPNPKSWKDRIEKSMFGMNGFLPKLIYTGIFILMQFI